MVPALNEPKKPSRLRQCGEKGRLFQHPELPVNPPNPRPVIPRCTNHFEKSILVQAEVHPKLTTRRLYCNGSVAKIATYQTLFNKVSNVGVRTKPHRCDQKRTPGVDQKAH